MPWTPTFFLYPSLFPCLTLHSVSAAASRRRRWAPRWRGSRAGPRCTAGESEVKTGQDRNKCKRTSFAGAAWSQGRGGLQPSLHFIKSNNLPETRNILLNDIPTLARGSRRGKYLRTWELRHCAKKVTKLISISMGGAWKGGNMKVTSEAGFQRIFLKK